MSAPQPPREPERAEGEALPFDPEAGLEGEFDLPYRTPPAPRPRLVRKAPGAVRAFLFLTAAFIVGAILGQLLGTVLALCLVGERLPLRSPERMEEAVARLAQQHVQMTVFCIGAVSLLLMLAVTLTFTRLWDRRPLSSVGFQLDLRAVVQFGAGLALGAALMGAIFAIEVSLGWLRVAGVVTFPHGLAHAVLWFGALLPAAAAEEVMLRGYTFQALKEQWGGEAATILTALVFAALHNLNPHAGWPSFEGIFVSGILFGTAVLASGRLWLPIGLHVAWNLFEGPVLGFPVSGIPFPSDVTPLVTGPPLWTGGDFGPEAGLLGILASAAGALILLAARRKA
jgi:CAAX protease family protein